MVWSPRTNEVVTSRMPPATLTVPLEIIERVAGLTGSSLVADTESGDRGGAVQDV